MKSIITAALIGIVSLAGVAQAQVEGNPKREVSAYTQLDHGTANFTRGHTAAVWVSPTYTGPSGPAGGARVLDQHLGEGHVFNDILYSHLIQFSGPATWARYTMTVEKWDTANLGGYESNVCIHYQYISGGFIDGWYVTSPTFSCSIGDVTLTFDWNYYTYAPGMGPNWPFEQHQIVNGVLVLNP